MRESAASDEKRKKVSIETIQKYIGWPGCVQQIPHEIYPPDTE